MRAALRSLLALLAVVALAGAFGLEGTLADQGRRAATSSAPRAAATEAPSREGHEAAARRLTAQGDFAGAAREAELAARLAPGDADAAARAARALDLALLARLRPAARALAAAGALVLLALLGGALRRRRRARRRAAWLDHLRVDVALGADGPSRREAGALVVSPRVASVAVDVFLRSHGAPRRRPRPGPTLAVVLSSAEAGRSVRLRPVRDVKGEAVRVRLRGDALAAVLGSPGRWRVEARVDGRALGEGALEVAPRGAVFAA